MKCCKTTLIAQPLYQVGLRKLQTTWQSVKEFDSNIDTDRQTDTDKMPNAQFNEWTKKLFIWKTLITGLFLSPLKNLKYVF